MQFARACWAAILALPLCAAPSAAQNIVSFMSSNGFDGNTCNNPAGPCRTLTGALSKTNAGGTIYCLDSGEFSGGITNVLNKTITIDCAGTGASIRPPAGTGLTVSGTTTNIMHIRGLKISSLNANGIYINGSTAAASVRVEDCDIMGASAGIGFGPPSSPTAILELSVFNTTISNSANGIDLIGGGGAIKATIDNVRLVNNLVGLNAIGTAAISAPGARAAVRNAVITGNRDHGVKVQGPTTGVNQVMIQYSLVSHNGVGILATGPNAAVSVSGSMITQNDTGLSAPGVTTLTSYGTNSIEGNITANGAFTGLVTLK